MAGPSEVDYATDILRLLSPLQRRVQDALRRPAFTSKSGRCFVGAGILDGPASTKHLPPLHPPVDLQAFGQEGGIRLSWASDPRDPVVGIHWRILRWVGSNPVQELPPVSTPEFLDSISCEGLLYRYQVRTVLERDISLPGEVGQRRARRESPAASTQIRVPRTAVWRLLGQNHDGRLVLELLREGLPDSGPLVAGPGEALGSTGWFLDGLRVRETTHLVGTRLPRFDASGRRVIIRGQPADRIRSVTERRSLANLLLLDPCGTGMELDLLLPPGNRGD